MGRRKGELTPAQLELRDRFSEGLACYRSLRWDESRRAFEAALAIVPNDGPSAVFINRLWIRPLKTVMAPGALSRSKALASEQKPDET